MVGSAGRSSIAAADRNLPAEPVPAMIRADRKLAGLINALRLQVRRAVTLPSPIFRSTVTSPTILQDTTHLVDPELLSWVANGPAVTYDPELVAVVRAAMTEQVASSDPDADGLPVSVSEHKIQIASGEPQISILVATPKRQSPVRFGILYVHGGGFIVGSAGLALPFIRQVVAALDCVVAAVDYRLAPEVSFPVPLEDCYAALVWFAREATALGVDPTRIAVMGESSGAGLAAALALVSRDRRGPAIKFQSLLCPMLDDRTVTEPDPNPTTGQFIWNRDSNRFAWKCYLGREPGSQGVSHYAAPARAINLSELPSTHIQVGTLDLFFDENLEFVRRLARAAVPVAFEVYPGAYHGFELMYPSEVTKDVQARRLSRLARALACR
ncbi:alpha/beta hydrolase [Methylobacterium amylolyticum]|uniref:alpha/beta hydrolase n=1 Tax=Methylobacterium sp. NEAU 140 TaxID=3064945 RepID=UPI0035210AA6